MVGDDSGSYAEVRLATAYRLYSLLLELLDSYLGGDVMVALPGGSRLYILLTQALEGHINSLPLEIQLDLVDWLPSPTLHELTGDDGDAWEFERPRYARILGILEAASVRAGDRLDEDSGKVLATFSKAVHAYARALAQAKEDAMESALNSRRRGRPSAATTAVGGPAQPERDVFLSHASDDKGWVRQLYTSLNDAGVTSWFDEAELSWGTDLRAAIDWGLSAARFGIIVISPAFADRPWTEAELSGVFNRHLRGEMQMLPIWHGVDSEWVGEKYPLVAGIFALRSSVGIPAIVTQMVSKLERLTGSTTSGGTSISPMPPAVTTARPSPRQSVDPQTEWELEIVPLLAAIHAWSKRPDRRNTLLAAHLLEEMGIDREDQASLRNLAEMLREDYVSGPHGNNPLTGDGKVIDVAIHGLTEKGRLLLGRLG